MKAEDYKTEITLEELKGHYKTHFLTAGQFMDLVKKWHKNLLVQENLDLKKQNMELAKVFRKSVKIVEQMDVDVRVTFQWCYNYIDKQKNSDEKTELIIELKNNGVL